MTYATQSPRIEQFVRKCAVFSWPFSHVVSNGLFFNASSCPRSLMLFHRSRSRTSGYTAAPTLSVHACLVLASIPIRSCSVLLPVHAFYPAIYSCPFLSGTSLYLPCRLPIPLYALLFSLHAHLSTPRRKIWELYMAYSIKRIHAHTYRGDCREVAHERSEHSIRSI